MEKKADLRNMSLRSRIQYIWMYYKIWILGSALILFIIGYAFYATSGIHKDTVINVTLVNADEIMVSDSRLFDEFIATYFDPNLEKAEIAANLNISLDDSGTASGTAVQVLSAQILSGEIDALISDQDVITYLASGGSLANLEEVFEPAELDKYQDWLVYATDEASGDSYPVGISLEESSRFRAEHFMSEPAILGVGITSVNAEAVDMLLEYLMEGER